MNLVDSLAGAIAKFEGFYKTGSLAQRNNNPGNLRTWGSTPTSGGYAVFPTLDAGWAALKRQIQINIDRGLTMYEFFAGKSGVYPGYAPAADSNEPYHYARTVASWIGVDPSTTLKSVQAGESPSPPLAEPPGKC